VRCEREAASTGQSDNGRIFVPSCHRGSLRSSEVAACPNATAMCSLSSTSLAVETSKTVASPDTNRGYSYRYAERREARRWGGAEGAARAEVCLRDARRWRDLGRVAERANAGCADGRRGRARGGDPGGENGLGSLRTGRWTGTRPTRSRRRAGAGLPSPADSALARSFVARSDRPGRSAPRRREPCPRRPP